MNRCTGASGAIGASGAVRCGAGAVRCTGALVRRAVVRGLENLCTAPVAPHRSHRTAPGHRTAPHRTLSHPTHPAHLPHLVPRCRRRGRRRFRRQLAALQIALAIEIALASGDPGRGRGARQVVIEPFEDAVVVVDLVRAFAQPVIFAAGTAAARHSFRRAARRCRARRLDASAPYRRCRRLPPAAASSSKTPCRRPSCGCRPPGLRRAVPACAAGPSRCDRSRRCRSTSDGCRSCSPDR